MGAILDWITKLWDMHMRLNVSFQAQDKWIQDGCWLWCT